MFCTFHLHLNFPPKIRNFSESYIWISRQKKFPIKFRQHTDTQTTTHPKPMAIPSALRSGPNLNFPPKNIWTHTHATPKTNGHPSGENFGVGWTFWVQVKILGSVENFGFGRKCWVWVKILVSGKNCGFGWKF